MIFTKSILNDAFVIDIEKKEDDRGFFARSWCRREFEAHGLNPNLAQCNISFNPQKGTLRGMHFQTAPCEEVKIVRCTRGEIYDVIIDLRPGSSTFKEWLGVTVSEEKRNMLYIPKGFAHGFLTLKDNTEVFYQMSEFYSPDHARGVRWNDPAFGILWPGKVQLISDKDRNYPDL